MSTPRFIKYLFILSVMLLRARNVAAVEITHGNRPATIRIIENKGQWEPEVLFKANIPGGFLFITRTGLAYSLIDEKSLNGMEHNHNSEGVVKGHNLRVDFAGCNANPAVVKEHVSSEYYNYFQGSDASKWAHHCYAYEKVILRNLYPHIDLEIVALDGSFKTNFIVHPGGKPAAVKIKYSGPDKLAIYDGALNVFTSTALLKEEKPVTLQDREVVPSAFVLQDDVLSYKVAAYNPYKDLVIDPTVIFATYSGSAIDNWGFTATYDIYGNAYSGGTVYGLGFPVTVGAFQVNYAGGVRVGGSDLARDAGILKYSPDGTQLLWATYLGGSNNEQPHSMVCDSNGNLIVMGSTASVNFPVTANAYDKTHNGLYDIYVTKIAPNGASLIGSTFFGGALDDGLNTDATHGFYDATLRPLTYNYGDQYRGEVTIDANGSIFVASTTHSSGNEGFPVLNGYQTTYGGGTQDGCLAKFTTDLSSLTFSTYIGGDKADAAYGITFDNSGSIFVCGGTASTNNTVTGGSQFVFHGSADGFIAKIAPSGNNLEAFVHLGTPSYDQAYFLQTDKQQNIYVTGQTQGNYPTTTGVYKNVNGRHFITMLDRNLTTVKASTVFGANGQVNISPSAFLVDVCGRVYVSGWGGQVNQSFNGYVSNTVGLPVTANAVQKTTDGSDFYLLVLTKDLRSLNYATYFGGTISAEHVDGGTSRFDRNGTVYQSVCGGCGGNSDFPTTVGAHSRINKSSNCNNALFKIHLNVSEYPPEFQDTLVKVMAGQKLTFPFTMKDKDGDTVFYTYSGSVLSYRNPATITKSIGAGFSSGLLTWQTECKDYTGDTLEIQLSLTDNGCPLVRTGSGKIRILVVPVPVIPPPFPQCLKTLDDNTVKLEWSPGSPSPNFKSYKIFRKKNGGAPECVATLSNQVEKLFIDTGASQHVINNYCYFIVAYNQCDSTNDTSRTICSLLKNDTSTIPAFIFSKDTLLRVFAFDTLEYRASIRSVDPHDSVYIQYDGSIPSYSNNILLGTKNNLSEATLDLKWVGLCSSVHSTDTPYLQFYVKDNQCPSPVTARGRIRIVVDPPPGNPPPALDCIRLVDEHTVEIRWPGSPVNKYFKKFVLLKKDASGTTTQIAEVPNDTGWLVIDKNATDNLKHNYCYALTAVDVCGSYGDTSPYRCTVRQPSDYPGTTSFHYVTVKDNKSVAVFWKKSTLDNFLSYSVQKRSLYHHGSFVRVYASDKIDDTTFVDTHVRVQDSSYCYRITQYNTCGLESAPADMACSILLKGISNPFEHALRWNGYNYWPAPVFMYDVVRVQPELDDEYLQPTFGSDTATVDDHLNYENGLYHYRVVANEHFKGLGYTSMSNDVTLIQAPLLHVPNAFTPNDDGLNDSWNPVPVFVKDYDLKIYDRWGRVVFETNNKHDYYQGLMQSGSFTTADVFVYLITYTGWDGSSHVRKGNLTLLK